MIGGQAENLHGSNFTFTTAIGDLDLLGYVEPLGDYERIAEHVETYDIEGLMLKVLSLDDLIRIKSHLGRPKDRESLFQLQAIKRERERTDQDRG